MKILYSSSFGMTTTNYYLEAAQRLSACDDDLPLVVLVDDFYGTVPFDFNDGSHRGALRVIVMVSSNDDKLWQCREKRYHMGPSGFE